LRLKTGVLDADQIKTAFSEFGEVTYVTVMKRAGREVRGLLIFRDPLIAEEVCAMHTVRVKGDEVKVSAPQPYQPEG
jgi:hypothetical protein